MNFNFSVIFLDFAAMRNSRVSAQQNKNVFFCFLRGAQWAPAAHRAPKKLPRGGARMRDDEREVQLFLAGSGHETVGIPRDFGHGRPKPYESLGQTVF